METIPQKVDNIIKSTYTNIYNYDSKTRACIRLILEESPKPEVDLIVLSTILHLRFKDIYEGCMREKTVWDIHFNKWVKTEKTIIAKIDVGNNKTKGDGANVSSNRSKKLRKIK